MVKQQHLWFIQLFQQHLCLLRGFRALGQLLRYLVITRLRCFHCGYLLFSLRFYGNLLLLRYALPALDCDITVYIMSECVVVLHILMHVLSNCVPIPGMHRFPLTFGVSRSHALVHL
jgi:hypothetical protein